MNFIDYMEMFASLAIYAGLLFGAHTILDTRAKKHYDGVDVIMQGNTAVAIRRGAFYMGLGIALYASFNSSGVAESFLGIVFESILWGLLTLGALLVSLLVNDRAILPGVDNTRALGRGNISVAIVEAAALLGTAMIFSGSIDGSGPFMSTVVFFVLGQAAMVGTVWGYEHYLSKVNLVDEIAKDSGNLSAAILLAGKIIGTSIVIMAAVSGDFMGWALDLKVTLLALVISFVVLIAAEYLVDLFLIPKRVVHELVQEQNTAGVVLVAMIGIGVAWVVTAVVPI